MTRDHVCKKLGRLLEELVYSIGSRNSYLVQGEKVALARSSNLLNSQRNDGFPHVSQCKKIIIARHKCCEVYCGARETVGGSSVSSGCWGEDSNHENEWALRPPRCSAHSLFYGPQTSTPSLKIFV